MKRRCQFTAMRRTVRARSATAAAAVAAAQALFTASTPANAHSFLVEATPSSKDHVAEPPKTIKLRFGGGVEPAYSRLTIESPDGKVFAQGAVGAPDKPRELTLDAPQLSPGRYVIRFRVLSQDGHIVEGSYEFFVDAK
jgi:methionine-rich copper-binding protein CopC